MLCFRNKKNYAMHGSAGSTITSASARCNVDSFFLVSYPNNCFIQRIPNPVKAFLNHTFINNYIFHINFLLNFFQIKPLQHPAIRLEHFGKCVQDRPDRKWRPIEEWTNISCPVASLKWLLQTIQLFHNTCWFALPRRVQKNMLCPFTASW